MDDDQKLQMLLVVAGAAVSAAVLDLVVNEWMNRRKPIVPNPLPSMPTKPTRNYDLKNQDLFFARKIHWKQELNEGFTGGISGCAAKVFLQAMSVVPSFSFSEDGMPVENPAVEYQYRYANLVPTNCLSRCFYNPFRDIREKLKKLEDKSYDQDRQMFRLNGQLSEKISVLKSQLNRRISRLEMQLELLKEEKKANDRISVLETQLNRRLSILEERQRETTHYPNERRTMHMQEHK